MKRASHITTALTAFLLGAWAMAQVDTVSLGFSTLTINDGLSQGLVHAIAQDAEGFMWFGTKDGLNRFDGYTFTVFRHDPEDSTSISQNMITSLYVDDHGRLWVGTNDGVDLFDKRTERFHHLRIDDPKRDLGDVTGMRLDLNGDLWIGTTNRLFKLTFEKPLGDRAAVPRFSTQEFGSGYATVARTRDGSLWGSYGDIDYRIHPRHGMADLIDTLDQRRRGILDIERSSLMVVEDPVRNQLYGLWDYAIAERMPDDTWRTILEFDEYRGWLTTSSRFTRQGADIWISTFKGLLRFEVGTRHLSFVKGTDPGSKNILSAVKCAVPDGDGTLWVGSAGYGLAKYDPRVERFHTWHDVSIKALNTGADGTILVSRYNQATVVFDPKVKKYTLELEDDLPQVHATLLPLPGINWEMSVQDPGGAYWMTLSWGRILRSDPTNGDLRLIEPKFDSGVHDRGYMIPMFIGASNALWCGGDTALWRIDRSTLEAEPFVYPFPAILNPYAFVAALHEGSDGIVWAGTMSGLLRLDPRTGKWTHYPHVPGDPKSIAVDIIFSICADPQDPVGTLWLGTNGGGLNRFDTRTGQVTRFSTADGLPNDVVYGVLADDAGSLWMSTNKGIARFDPRTQSFRNFGEGDGLQSDEFNRHAYCKDAGGRLWFGGVNGFNHFDPKELVEDSTAVPVKITGIKLINEPVVFGRPGSPLTLPSHMSSGMEIPYSANMVTFTFAAMEFSALRSHRYRYKLEGFDKDWIDAGTDNSAIYTNLDPGTYTFRVRSRNRDGIWDEKGTSFILAVRPPWWRTGWFYAACVLAIGGAVLLYIRMLRKQNIKLEETVDQRTRELSLAKERAEASEKFKQQFLANMSHEIRTPMNAIMGMTGILKRNEQLPEQRKYLDAVSQSSENLLVILNDILDLSKLEAGKIELEKVPFDVRSLITNVQDIICFKAEEKGLAVEVAVEEDVPPRLVGDPTRLNQVLLNLAGNAVKFTEQGSVTVRASVLDLQAGHCTLVLDVIDTGIGIPEDRLEKIFEEFTQAYGDTTRKYGGTGLGLTITKRLVALQGGSIAVRSEKGRGSTFTVAIPYAIADVERDDVLPAQGRDGSPAGELHDLKILLAEDNEFNVIVAKDELADAIPRVRVDVAANGRIAVEKVKANDYDVILMDVQMPEMNGYDATKAIRALGGERSRTPILAMTANVMKEELERCREAGMDGHVPKPFTRAELVGSITAALSRA